MAKVSLDDFRVPFWAGGDDGNAHGKAGKAARKKNGAFRLADFDPADKPFSSSSKPVDRDHVAQIGERIDALQDKLHAQPRARLLLILQGMDTSGKDGTIRGVFHEVDPLGLRVVSFRAPSETEAAHDFLWRVHTHAPAAGELAIFNRSHYEDVLVPRIKGTIDRDECERRYQHIRHFEALLAQSGTTILKCFLHISSETQRDRLQARIDDPGKNWKFDPSDLDARKHWDDYQQAYEDALAATSTDYAPWYVIPANSKTHRNLMVAELIEKALADLHLDYPPANPALAGVVVV